MYCILTYILSRIDEADVIAYTDDYESGVVDVEAVGKAIAGADALINAHIAKRYSVPVSPVPDMVRDLAVDIAIYKICSHRSLAPDDRRKNYEDAVRMLGRIASGQAVIPDAAAAPAGSGDHAVNLSSGPRVFSRDSLKGY